MLGTTLRYDYEVRDEKKFFKSIPRPRVKKDMVELASHMLDQKAGRFDPGEFKDEYELALRKLVRRKAAGHTIERPEEEPPPTNVINLMDTLRESMKHRKASDSRSRRAPRKKAARRKAS
jgi:Ku protein